MGTRTMVNGYIVADSEDDAHNRLVVETYDYNEVYPLRAVFSLPKPGYGGSVIAFADAIKADRDDWPEWRVAFEDLLGRLRWREAEVCLAEAEASASERYGYVLIERTASKAEAVRFELSPGGEVLNETELTI
jgi:hypothetical protein